MKKQGVAHGAIILAVSSVMVKIIGAVFKIPIGAILGPEGMASFSIAYNIYALFFVISTAGIPVAVSKIVAERKDGGILKVILPAVSIFGAFFCAILFFGADFFASLMGSKDASLAICAIAPAIFFVSISSVLRGYHQGTQNMLPTAVSEVIEAMGKLAFGLGFAIILTKRCENSHIVVAGAVVGVSIGAALSAGYLLLCKRDVSSENALHSTRSILRLLIKNAVPITLGASVVSFSNVIDSALIMRLLQAVGFSEQRALWLFGSYNYAATIFNLPGVVVQTFGISMIPSIAQMKAVGAVNKISQTFESSMKIAMTLAFSASFGLFALGIECMYFLYGESVEASAIYLSGRLLAFLSLSIPCLTAASISASVLQAMGNVKTPMYSMIAGAVIKIACNLIFVRIPNINIYGACIGTLASYSFTMVNNMHAIVKKSGVKISVLRIFFKPIITGLLTGVCAKCIMYISSFVLSTRIAIVLSIFGGVFICVLAIFSLKIVTKSDKKLLFSQKNITIF